MELQEKYQPLVLVNMALNVHNITEQNILVRSDRLLPFDTNAQRNLNILRWGGGLDTQT
jgi:hypothetical protein